MHEESAQLEAAWEQVVEARGQGDERSETIAWARLALALHRAERFDEARAVLAQAQDRAWRRSDSLEVLLAMYEALLTDAAVEELVRRFVDDEPVVWAQAVEARQRNDERGEASAWARAAVARHIQATAGPSLVRVRYADEATRLLVQAQDRAWQRSDRLEVLLAMYEALLAHTRKSVEDPYLRGRLTATPQWAYETARRICDALPQWGATRGHVESAKAKLDAFVAHRPKPRSEIYTPHGREFDNDSPGRGFDNNSSEDFFEMVVVGFVAVKIVGPFLEEWARKLGEQLGESTVRALGRIRLRMGSWLDRRELEADVPDTSAPTTLVLPEELSPAARQAILDLDPTEETLRGRTLYWSETTQTWERRAENEHDDGEVES